MASNYKVIQDDSSFNEAMSSAGGRLLVADFTSSRCPPCQRISPIFAEMANKYPGAVLISVDIQKCPDAAMANNVTATPTFLFYRNKTKIDMLTGADPEALEARMNKHYNADALEVADAGVPGHMDLLPMLNKKGCQCLNQDKSHTYDNALFNASSNSWLQSDVDEQILLHLDFSQVVKVNSLRIKAPEGEGPRQLRVFVNQPHVMDFDAAMDNQSLQDITLLPKHLTGELVKLKFAKLQNVKNLILFFQDNQEDGEVTRIDSLQIIGSPMSTTNMGDFKRVAGKAGESHG